MKSNMRSTKEDAQNLEVRLKTIATHPQAIFGVNLLDVDKDNDEWIDDMIFMASVAWNLAVLPQGSEWYQQVRNLLMIEDPLTAQTHMECVMNMMNLKKELYPDDLRVIVHFDITMDDVMEVESVKHEIYLEDRQNIEDHVYDQVVEVMTMLQ